MGWYQLGCSSTSDGREEGGEDDLSRNRQGSNGENERSVDTPPARRGKLFHVTATIGIRKDGWAETGTRWKKQTRG